MGTGDALWYANMLADFVTQQRAGIFPVFVGQTQYAFNGAVYPLRVAPLFQHLAGTIDLLTLHSLGFFALQHATVVLCGFAGLFTSYLTGTWLCAQHRWAACAGAILYLACPGVLGTIYTQDLYMTWMTVPFLPLAVYGIIRTFRREDWLSQLWFVVPLAALWFAHSPVALWMSLIAAGTQAVRLLFIHRTIAAWKHAAVGAALFGLLAHYPFVSVANLAVPGTTSTVMTGLAEQDRITNVIREVFPAILRPLSENGDALSDLQLGYALWAVTLVVGLCALRPKAPPELRLLVLACGFLLLLLLPIPGITDWLWGHVPEQIKRITFYWPMHRFYLLLAAVLSACGLIVIADLMERNCKVTVALTSVLAVLCGWSLWEARQFVRAGELRTAPKEVSDRSQKPENLLLMNHAYGLFSALPAYFSNGVMAPWTETRLLASDGKPLLPILANQSPLKDIFRGTIDANPGVINLSPSLRLQPGQHYQLELEFAHSDLKGVLQIYGRTFFREYLLPKSGEPLAFGSAEGSSHVLPLWTTANTPEEVALRFIPSNAETAPAGLAEFARFRLSPESTGSIAVTSLLPFHVKVRSPQPEAWLETPRMFLPGYVADIAGQPAEVRRSEHGLAMVRLPQGESEVRLAYVAPRAVRVSYFVTLTAWAALLAGVIGVAWRRRPQLKTS